MSVISVVWHALRVADRESGLLRFYNAHEKARLIKPGFWVEYRRQAIHARF